MNSSSALVIAKLFLAIACAAAGAMLGWQLGRAPLQTQLAKQEAAHARERDQAAQAATLALQDAQTRGDALTNTLAQRQAQIDQLTREKRDAITKVTTGRPCLGMPALRLLNGAAGLHVAGLAESPGSTAAAGASAATHPDEESLVSTDTDIASWSIDAAAQYELCRGRLDALIDWHVVPTSSNTTRPIAHD